MCRCFYSLIQGVEVITTHSIDQSLQSVGGIQILLPLFSQLDFPNEDGSLVDVIFIIFSDFQLMFIELVSVRIQI